MTKRIFCSLFFSATIVLLLSLTFTVVIVHHSVTQVDKEEIQSFTETLATTVESQGIDPLQKQTFTQYQVTVRNSDNSILFRSSNHVFTKLSLYTYEKQLTNNLILSVSGEIASLRMILFDLITPLVIIFVVFLLFILFLASQFSRYAVNPIEKIELKNPQPDLVYPELKPLVQKLANQNQTIRSQMLDLFQQQQKFDTITDNMSEGMLIVDREGRVVSFNGAASGILSLSLEHKGQDIATLSPTPAFLSAVKEALEGKHPQQLIPIFERTYQVIGNPIRVKEELMGAVLALLDVTEREERDRLRQEFSANVSHELKTPLTSISGYAEIMKNGLVKPQDMSEFASRIYDEAGRLILLIGDIIQLSRLEENNLSAQIQQVDLYEIAKEIHIRLQHQANKKQIDLRLQGSSCEVKGVPHILDEMIYNLCDNAIKYNREKGSVTLTVLPREEDIMVAVADTGIGIPYEEQERVFERFYRIDKSHSKEIGGTGLGLSIVKHGAAFHEASIQLESVPGEGTCITLLFPKCQ